LYYAEECEQKFPSIFHGYELAAKLRNCPKQRRRVMKRSEKLQFVLFMHITLTLARQVCTDRQPAKLPSYAEKSSRRRPIPIRIRITITIPKSPSPRGARAGDSPEDPYSERCMALNELLSAGS